MKHCLRLHQKPILVILISRNKQLFIDLGVLMVLLTSSIIGCKPFKKMKNDAATARIKSDSILNEFKKIDSNLNTRKYSQNSGTNYLIK